MQTRMHPASGPDKPFLCPHKEELDTLEMCECIQGPDVLAVTV